MKLGELKGMPEKIKEENMDYFGSPLWNKHDGKNEMLEEISDLQLVGDAEKLLEIMFKSSTPYNSKSLSEIIVADLSWLSLKGIDRPKENGNG